jgi:ribonuclease HI
MEYQAMLEALSLIPAPPKPELKPLVIIETDSQTCIDGLTKFRFRWATRHWKIENGQPVENAVLIQNVGRLLDQMRVGFWKIKGHNHDPWNDLADSLAVRGRNQSKANVTVAVLFRPVVDRVEKLWGIPRLSLNPNSNLHDFWPPLVNKWGRHGEPEDFEIWCDQAPLRGPLFEGLTYEIVPRSSPGRVKPTARRNSIDLTVHARDGPPILPRALDWSPQPLVRTDDHPIPAQWQARVVFQTADAPEREWRGWFTEDDSEYDVERRAHTSLGIVGTWRRSSFWHDASGLTITMTNRRKEIPMRYSSGEDAEIKSIMIGEEDTVRVILLTLKAKSNFHLTDHASRPFGLDDCPFGYVSVSANPPLQLLHGSASMGKKREPTPKKDNQIAVEVKVGSAISVYPRSGPAAPQGYSRLLSDMMTKHGLTGPWHIAQVRAIDDRIQVEIADGEPLEWFCESICPPLKSEDDRSLRDAVGVGGWGINPPIQPMQTRSTVSKNRTARPVEVILHNLESDVVETIGTATDFQEAITLARRLGKVPKGLNIAGTEKTDEHILLVCKKGKIVAGEGVVSAVTAPKPKPKKALILPEKLAGPNPDAAFAPRNPAPIVPGTLNTETPASLSLRDEVPTPEARR